MSNKPYFFCDVDGVLNALIYHEVWVGKTDIASLNWWDAEYTNSKNWGIAKYEADPKTQYVIDSQATVDFSHKRQTIDGEETYKISKITLNYSSELISEIRKLIEEDKVDFYWLTTWRENAVEILNPLFGFPLNTPFLPWQERGRSDYSQSGKKEALHHFFSEKLVYDEEYGYKRYIPLDPIEAKEIRKPFIWIDDVATQGRENYPKFNNRNAKKYGFKQAYGMDNLIIRTDEQTGISREELQAIKRFVENPVSHNPPMPRKTKWDV